MTCILTIRRSLRPANPAPKSKDSLWQLLLKYPDVGWHSFNHSYRSTLCSLWFQGPEACKVGDMDRAHSSASAREASLHYDLLSRQALLAVPGVGALLDALGAYSARHAARLDRLRRATFLLDYTLAAMRVVAPGGEGLEAIEGSGLGLDDATGLALDAAAAGDGGAALDLDPVWERAGLRLPPHEEGLARGASGDGTPGVPGEVERGLQGTSSGSGEERGGGGAGAAAAADLPGSGKAGRGSKRKQRAGGVHMPEALANGHGPEETGLEGRAKKKSKKKRGVGAGAAAGGQAPSAAAHSGAQVTPLVELSARREQKVAAPPDQSAGLGQGSSKARREKLTGGSAQANGAPAERARAAAEAVGAVRTLKREAAQTGKGSDKGVALVAQSRTKRLLQTTPA